MATVHHPYLTGITRTVADSVVDAWVAAGWVLQAPDANYVDRAVVQAVRTSAGTELRATFDDGTERAIDEEAHRAKVLAPWRAALAGRDSAPAKWLAIGDSITEGGVVSSPERRWINRLTAQLRQRFQTTGLGTGGGFGYRPAYYEVPSQYMGTAETAYTGTQSKDATYGLGRRCARMTLGSTRTYKFTGTSFDVHYVRGPITGDMLISIDGGVATTIATNRAEGIADGNKWTSPALAAGEHTVVIEAGPNGDIFVNGLVLYNGDESKGIHQYDSAHWGYMSSGFGDDTKTQWAYNIKLVEPHLVTLATMTNDYQQGIDPAVVAGNYRKTIKYVRNVTANDPAFVIIAWPKRGDVDESTKTHKWADYIKACRDLADADPGVTLLDLSEKLDTADPNTLGLWAADKVHLSDKGAAAVADILAGYLSP